MTNKEIIEKRFAAFKEAVHRGGNLALCEQMQYTLDQSIDLHLKLEGGYHTHHTEESDSHGWAVADGTGVVGSGKSILEMPNEYGSAEEDAKAVAVQDNQEGLDLPD